MDRSQGQTVASPGRAADNVAHRIGAPLAAPLRSARKIHDRGLDMAQIGGETNVILLGWTQQYLRSLVEQETPDSILAAAWDEFYRVYDGLMRRFAMARGLAG